MLASMRDISNLPVLKAWKDIDIPTVIVTVQNDQHIFPSKSVRDQGTSTERMLIDRSPASTSHVAPSPSLGVVKKFASVSTEPFTTVSNTKGWSKNNLYYLNSPDEGRTRVVPSHQDRMLGLSHKWTYWCDCYEESSSLFFTYVTVMSNGHVCVVDAEMCQLLYFDGSSGKKLSQYN